MGLERTSHPFIVHVLPEGVQVADGTRWIPHVVARERSDGLWEARLEFRAQDGRPRRVTDRETTQPNRAAVDYWAGGLEPVYVEGAFNRAREEA